MKVLIVGNPLAGVGRVAGLVEEFAEVLVERGHEVEVFLSREPGDIGRRVEKLGEDPDTLVVAGGDGTVNEVLNGLDDPSRIPLLQLPAGTANMLARDLGLPTRPPELVPLLERGSVRRLDMGLVGRRRFLLLASAGFDATVAEAIKKESGKAMGYRDYVLPIIGVLRRYRPANLTIRVDDGVPVTGTDVMALKVKHYGGFFVFSDNASMDSGHFDIGIFQAHSIVAVIKFVVAALLRRVPKQKGVTYLKGTRVTIDSDRPVPVQLDGDYIGTTPVEVRMVPSCVPVLVP